MELIKNCKPTEDDDLIGWYVTTCPIPESSQHYLNLTVMTTYLLDSWPLWLAGSKIAPKFPCLLLFVMLYVYSVSLNAD